jgi:hypothetical protein
VAHLSEPGLISAGAIIGRERAVTRRLGVRAWTAVVGSLVLGSAFVRILVAQRHTSPRYWPDEYVYAALSRSLVHGHLEVRGQPAHFYAILQPILAAPIWHFFPAYEAYRLIQVGNAIAASLVVIPLWFLGRELGLPRLTTYLCCAYALLVPTLAMIPVTISDFIAYPLTIGAVAVGVRSLNEPTRGRQVAFLCLAGLATLARIQYFVLVPAYLLAAAVVDRRRAHREHKWVFLATLPAFAGAILAVTGYYAVGASSFRPSMLTWMALQCFLLSLTAGVVVVPGAVAGLLRPKGRVETAFSAFAGVFIVLVLAEASQPAAAEGRYKERYLLTIVPLLALAFAMSLRGRRPQRSIVIAVGAALTIVAARVPITGYTANATHYDSQTLSVAWLLQRHLGVATSSLVVALFITVAAALAMAGTWRHRINLAVLPVAIAVTLAVSAVAVHMDGVVNKHVDSNPAWIDAASRGEPVTLVSTPSSARFDLLEQIYWSSSVSHEVLLEDAAPTDAYATTRIKPGPNGELSGVHGYFLLDTTGTQAVVDGATTVATHRDDVLYKGEHPRFRVLVENQLSTGWLSPYTRLRAWPGRAGTTTSPVVRFTLSLPPASSRRVHMHVGSQIFVVRSASALHLTCRSPKWPFTLLLQSPDVAPDALQRPVTAGLTHLSVKNGRASDASGCTATTR